MANPDIPCGFTPTRALDGGPIIATLGNAAASQTVAVGDACIMSSGAYSIAASTSGSLAGVVAPQAGVTRLGGNCISSSTLNDDFWFYDERHVFAGQCSGTYAVDCRHKLCDIEGTTGIMEVNEDATTETVIQILKEILGTFGGRTGLVVGANSMVEFVIHKAQLAKALHDRTS